MSLPPQLIGIKRRRLDEPVDVLYLEQDRSSSKRRFTDFVFQRLIPNKTAPPRPHPPPGHSLQTQERVRSAGNYTTGGAPVVQATSPGAEYRDALQRRAVRAHLLHQQKATLAAGDRVQPAPVPGEVSDPTDSESAQPKRPIAARRFHLSRNTVTPASSKRSGGIRKHKTPSSSNLATFVERYVDCVRDGELQVSNNSFAIDRLIDDATFSPPLVSVQHGVSAVTGYSPKRIPSFVKAPAEAAKTGNSIKDHPSTWDHESDQLADELAAFALEISQEDHAEKTGPRQMAMPGRPSPDIAATEMEMDDVYVYETYLRVPRSALAQPHEGTMNSVGMLVIEEQDEELWQTFAEDEDDSEWDEEDADSNAEDNPRNDYPEDEVSSEDEYGHSAYKYRYGASDEEEYDLEDPRWSGDENEGV